MGGAILHQIVRLGMLSCPNPFRIQSGHCVWPQFVFCRMCFVFVLFFAISRDIHTVAVYVVVLMEHTSAELCELSKLGALLKWVGVPEASALAVVARVGDNCASVVSLAISGMTFAAKNTMDQTNRKSKFFKLYLGDVASLFMVYHATV